MQRHLILSHVLSLFTAACTIIRSEPQQITHEGTVVSIVEVKRDNYHRDADYFYEITYPDGTTGTSPYESSPEEARSRMYSMISFWRSKQERKEATPGPSNTIAGPPQDPEDLPETRDSN